MKQLKKLFSGINKNLLAGILCLIAAAVFILAPGNILHILMKIAGGIVILAAIGRFLYAVMKLTGPFMTVTVINAAFLFIVGIVMLLSPGGALRFIYVAIGIYLIVNALMHVFAFATLPKKIRKVSWWIEIITSIIILILGLWLVLSPDAATRATEVIAGISLIVKSVELFGKAAGEIKRSDTAKRSGDIEAEFIDKSNEL